MYLVSTGEALTCLLRLRLISDVKCLSVCVCVCSLPIVFYLILTDEFLVRDVGRQIRVQESTESQAVTPAAAEVGHINILREKRKRKEKNIQVTNKPMAISHNNNELKVLII